MQIRALPQNPFPVKEGGAVCIPWRPCHRASLCISSQVAKIKALFQSAIQWIINLSRALCCKKPIKVTSHPHGATPSPVTPQKAAIGEVLIDVPIEIPPAIHQSVEINRANIHEVPDRDVYLATLEAIAADRQNPIDVKDILSLFDQAFAPFPNETILTKVDNTDQFDGPNPTPPTPREITKTRARERLQRGYLNYFENKKNDLCAQSVALHLKGIIFELRKPELPIEKKQEYLRDLIQAAGHCEPRLYDTAGTIYRRASNQIDTMKTTVLRFFQQVKEDCLLQVLYRSPEPLQALNQIRKTAGPVLGLKTDRVYVEDVYLENEENRKVIGPNGIELHTAEEFQNLFEKACTPQMVLKLMMHEINLRLDFDASFNKELSAFIENEIKKYVFTTELSQAADAALPRPYQQDVGDPHIGHLTPEGIRFLLVELDHVTPKVLNGHLVAPPAA